MLSFVGPALPMCAVFASSLGVKAVFISLSLLLSSKRGCDTPLSPSPKCFPRASQYVTARPLLIPPTTTTTLTFPRPFPVQVRWETPVTCGRPSTRTRSISMVLAACGFPSMTLSTAATRTFVCVASHATLGWPRVLCALCLTVFAVAPRCFPAVAPCCFPPRAPYFSDLRLAVALDGVAYRFLRSQPLP